MEDVGSIEVLPTVSCFRVGSGTVMKIFTNGRCLTKRPRMEKITKTGLIVDTRPVHDDDTRDFCRREGICHQVLELRYERIACHGRIVFYNPNNFSSKCAVPTMGAVGKRMEFSRTVTSVVGPQEARGSNPTVHWWALLQQRQIK